MNPRDRQKGHVGSGAESAALFYSPVIVNIRLILKNQAGIPKMLRELKQSANFG